LVFCDDKDRPQVLIGGRCEPGETFEETLQREALEKAGVEVADTILLGFPHYRHLGPKPPSYTYPYPSFLHVVYRSRARIVRPEAVTHHEHMSRSEFLSIEQALALPLRERDRPFLSVAISRPA
jgi:8-oxo-dGTP pyrophosphatase MutT (NUDIX family)